MGEIIIRPYKKEDRSHIRDITWDTAFMGESADIFFGDKEILADFLTLYYTDYEPQCCFVAEYNGGVVGYLTGAKDIVVLRRVFAVKIVLRLLIKTLMSGAMFRRKNIIFFFRCLVSFIKGEFQEPDFSRVYPAVLHINIKEGFRREGVGSRLISVYLGYLIKEKVIGVHFSSLSENASVFFTKQGFNLLHRSTRSYFRHILHRDITVYTYGKRLS